MQKRIVQLLNRYEKERTFFFSACEECSDLQFQPYISSLFDSLVSLKQVIEHMYKLYASSFDISMHQRFTYMRVQFDRVENVYLDACKRFANLRIINSQAYSRSLDLPY